MEAGPVGEHERRPALDVLRGLAIAGVIVANAFTFAYPMLSSSPQVAALRGSSAADRAAQIAVALFVEGKFYTLLSVLFGMGLMLQSRRAEQQGARFTGLYLRRLLILFAIGAAHGILLYAADILSFYALIAMAAMPFRGLQGCRLLSAAAAVLFLGLLLAGAADNSAGRPDWKRVAQGQADLPVPLAAALTPLGIDPTEFARFMGGEQRIYQRGSWQEITRLRAYSSLLLALPAKLTYLGLYVLGLFLFGMYLADSGVLDSLALLRQVTWPAIGAGLLLEMAGVVSRTATIAGTAVLAAGYAGALVLIRRRDPDAFAMRALTALGRLALTNYLLQSLLYGLFFYSTGLGLHGRLSAAEVFLLTPILCGFQTAFSLAWLRRFRFGPFEWAWRSLTFGRRFPIGRDAGVSEELS